MGTMPPPAPSLREAIPTSISMRMSSVREEERMLLKSEFLISNSMESVCHHALALETGNLRFSDNRNTIW